MSEIQKPFLVGVAGGSGSGKSTVVNMIKENYPEDQITVIREDHYYRDLAHLSKEEQNEVNFDHPDSLNSELMISQLESLSKGIDIKCPIYDFKTRCSVESDELSVAKKIIIFDGILSFCHEEMRELFSLKIFVDVASDIRVLRRVSRDVRERGRNLEGVISQYLTTVRPMHEKFVEPTKKYADEIIPWVDRDQSVVDNLISLLP